MSREIDGRTYDLFVHHQVAFPLTAGPFAVGPAVVSYNLPLRLSILSREVPHEVASDTLTVMVEAHPGEGRPDQYLGAVGRNLELEVSVDTGRFARGDAGTLYVTVNGRGNVALWPEPHIEWPPNLRVYPGETDVHVDYEEGIVGGSKTFVYLLMPDSVGGYAIPPASYVYFDLTDGTYRSAVGSGTQLVAREVRVTDVESSSRVTLRAPAGPAPVDRLVGRLTWPMWMVVFLLPPGLVLVQRTVPRLMRGPRRMTSATRPAGLEQADQRLRRAMERVVPRASDRDARDLAAALESVGVAPPVAMHAVRVRDRLGQSLYGPTPSNDDVELLAEVEEVLRALPHRERQAARVAGMGLALVVGTLGSVAAQSLSAERLMDARAFRQAADSFQVRAEQAPDEVAHWYNLGAARLAAEEPAGARAAWIAALRIRPRDPGIRRALNSLGMLDTVSDDLVFLAPVTPGETLVVGGLLWVVAWCLLLARRRARVVAVALALAVVLVTLSAYTDHRYAEHIALVRGGDVPLRVAPYGSASPLRRLTSDVAVRIERTSGPWLMVRRGNAIGWLLEDEVWRV